MKLPDDSIFYGDGRKMLAPQNAPEGTAPVRVLRGIACRMCRAFRERGKSYHSGQGATLWVVVTYCLEREIPFEVVRFEDEADRRVIGYTVKRKENQDEPPIHDEKGEGQGTEPGGLP